VIPYIRAALVLVVLSLAAWGGWTARAWLEDSRALDQAKAERDAAIARERAAETKATEVEKERARIAGELTKEKAKIHAEVQPIIKRVPVYIGGSDCALDVDGVRDLNTARGAALPYARRFVDGRPVTTRPDTP
jgi:hypothetical protein